MKNTHLFPLFTFLLAALLSCESPLGPEDNPGDETPTDDEPVTEEPVSVDLGSAGEASIDAPGSPTAGIVDDTSSYPDDATMPLISISGDLEAGETAVLSVTVDAGVSERDRVVRAVEVDGSYQWEEVGTTTLGSDGKTLSLEVTDLNGVWTVVTAPEPPTVTVTQTDGTDRTPAWNWTTPEGAGLFRYRLDSDDWVETTDTTTTIYTPPDPLVLGTHSLTVQAGTGTGVWSGGGSQTASVKYLASDYFDLTAGAGIEYQITDTFDYGGEQVANGGDPFAAWAVIQNDISANTVFAGIMTVTAVPQLPNREPDSALIFSTDIVEDPTLGTLWGFIGGVPERHSANLFRELVVIPELVADGTTTTDPTEGVVYAYSYNGDHSVGGTSFSDTVRIDVTIDAEAASNVYESYPSSVEGEGYVILAPDVGAVDVDYTRSDGTSLSMVYQSHGMQSRRTLTGVVKNNAGELAPDIPVHLDAIVGSFFDLDGDGPYEDVLSGTVTNTSGEFSLDVYGPVARIFAGPDGDGDGFMDQGSIGELHVSDTSSPGSLVITLP